MTHGHIFEKEALRLDYAEWANFVVDFGQQANDVPLLFFKVAFVDQIESVDPELVIDQKIIIESLHSFFFRLVIHEILVLRHLIDVLEKVPRALNERVRQPQILPQSLQMEAEKRLFLTQGRVNLSFWE